MEIKKLTVIVPRLPPSIDGLGDYGLSLARQLRLDFGVQTEFIVGDPKWSGESEIDGFKISKISSRRLSELIKLLPSDPNEFHKVLLHYVGYGYAKRGSPIWLVRALTEWKKKNDNNRLLTMFHECYAFGPIWTSQFWTSPLQRLLFNKLTKLSDQCLTSKNAYADNIRRHSNLKHKNISVLPVFSNVGELVNVTPLLERERTLVIFGSTGWRKYAYENFKEELNSVVQEFKINKIIDIGKPFNFPIETQENVKFESMGTLSSEEISRIFSRSMIGFFCYPEAYLSKSGIFASYCSHGLLPVGTWFEEQESDGVIADVHFLKAGNVKLGVDMEKAQLITRKAFEWYHTHDLKSHSIKYFELLRFDL